MKKIFFCSFLLPFSLYGTILIRDFRVEPATQYYYLSDQASQKVGHIGSYELPALGIVVVHSLYVPGSYREKGYAQQMLSLLLSEYQEQGYAFAYIQIGPYEKGQYLDENSDEYKKRVKKLEKLYTKFGFQPAPWYEQRLAGLVYPLVGVHAASEYLLKKDLSLQIEYVQAERDS